MKKVILFFIGLIALNFQNQAQIVKDIDGNVYNTVKIGEQIWLKENLKTTKYNDGIAIPLVTDSSKWANDITPAYCNYKNTTNTDTINNYGRLYNWYAVNTSKLCPTGWHVPSDSEWSTLTNYLGKQAGILLKETGTAHWKTLNTEVTNDSKFTALPAGFRGGYGIVFNNMGNYGYWWTATEDFKLFSWYRYMNYSNIVYRINGSESSGLSVRCLKD